MNGTNRDDGFYHGYEEDSEPSGMPSASPDHRSPASADALEQMEAMLAEYRFANGMKSSSYYESKNKASEKPAKMPDISFINANDEARRYDYQRDARTQMDDMLAAYRQSHGMKSSSYEERRGRTSGTSSVTPPSSWDNTDEEARRYAYQRDARAQMDDMIRAYQEEHKVKHGISKGILRNVSMSPFELGRRRMQAAQDLLSSRSHPEAGVKDPELFRQRYPSARTATGSDAMVRFLIALTAGILIIIVSISTFIIQTTNARRSHHAISSYPVVEGKIRNVSQSGTKKYRITYEYEYNGQRYDDSAEVSSSDARMLGAIGTNQEERPFKVYVNPDDPQKNVLLASPYPDKLWWLAAFFGLLIIIWGMKFFIDCHNGNYIVYKRNRINHFVRANTFPWNDPHNST